MARAEYREIACKSALNRVRGMAFGWSLNPYRGCAHGCQYCFARSTHRYLELGAGADFSGIIFVKTNLPAVLAGELGRRGWRREQVAVGTATDPYQAIEGRYQLTRRSLELFTHFRTPVSIVTKGTLIVRDADILQDLGRRAGATVCFSVPTVDREIWLRTEPGTPAPAQRLRVMEQLVSAGVHCGVLVAPLLPGLTADQARVTATVRAAAAHGARFIGSNVLHLGPDVREHFLGFLQQEYPDLLAGYQRLYGTKHAPKRYRTRVEERVREVKRTLGYRDRDHRRVERSPAPQQLSLGLDVPSRESAGGSHPSRMARSRVTQQPGSP